ncbi:hypothetical protein F1737_02135 [Methanoplanus sp. FWC-SCC4]|uniref:PEGA domain-containing protein n=1 Tax=Methanochimaera problematica TaxID=2609417 RepID=A0AA97FA17_9EURY|nr:hypothetical protein [Methanoplanus sp. FWC-SCC4]WOF15565.1 hypothetical protein F1737_02135 [Methanoplanus sp. FWC-SCC4]
MKKLSVYLMTCLVLIALVPMMASAMTVGGDQAWFNVHCNVDGASVYFDDDFKGEIVSGILSVPVYTTATPYKQINVEKAGYNTWNEEIKNYPAMGEKVDVYATLNPMPEPEPTLIGGDMGYYVVYCNVDGAKVYFNDDYKGDISNGELTVQVYTTGTPYTTYTVKMDGYTSFTAQVSDYPAKGETVKLHSTLTPETQPTKSPVSMFTVIFGLCIAGIGFIFLSKRK